MARGVLMKNKILKKTLAVMLSSLTLAVILPTLNVHAAEKKAGLKMEMIGATLKVMEHIKKAGWKMVQEYGTILMMMEL